MKRYGERFLGAGEFLSHCEDLKVKACREELEHYEKTGVMLPVVRLTYPDEYLIEDAHLRSLHSSAFVDISAWPELQRIVERPLIRFPEDYQGLTPEQLVHCFDREVNDNPHLTRPSGESFRAWDDYLIQVPDIVDGNRRVSTAEHFYSYWQVHQLYYIQKFPDLYKNRRLFEYVTQQLSVTLLSRQILPTRGSLPTSKECIEFSTPCLTG